MMGGKRRRTSFISPEPCSNKIVKFDNIEYQTSMAQLQPDSTGTPKKTKFRMPDTPDPRQKQRRKSNLKNGLDSDVEIINVDAPIDNKSNCTPKGSPKKTIAGSTPRANYSQPATPRANGSQNGSPTTSKDQKDKNKNKNAAKSPEKATSFAALTKRSGNAIDSESNESSIVAHRKRGSRRNIVSTDDDEEVVSESKNNLTIIFPNADKNHLVDWEVEDDGSIEDGGDSHDDNEDDQENDEMVDENDEMDDEEDNDCNGDGIDLGSIDTDDPDESGEDEESDNSFVVEDDEGLTEESSDDDEEEEVNTGDEEVVLDIDDVYGSAEEERFYLKYMPIRSDDVDDVSKMLEEKGYESLNIDEFCLTVASRRKRSAPITYRPFVFSDHFDDDSTMCALKALSWIISPCEVPVFFQMFYQRSAFVVKRGIPDYYGDLFSTDRFIKMLQKNTLMYGWNINAAIYHQGVRETPNGQGRVTPISIAEHMRLGHSVQCVNPQAYDRNLHYICEILQEAFSCFVGANSYITPGNSRGFAPHWDDVDAFILQLEGSKHWTVSAPLDVDHKLPTESSSNFNDDVLTAENRRVVFDGVLEPGDMLYIPRGFIHRAYTTLPKHSLHVTISTSRKFTYSDFLKRSIEEMIDRITDDNLLWRRGLPPMFFNVGGVAAIDYSSSDFMSVIHSRICRKMFPQLADGIANFSAGLIDVTVVDFMRVALPPLLCDDEIKLSALNVNNVMVYGTKKVEYSLETRVRLIRRHGQRLVYVNENTAFIAHRMNNPMYYDETREPTTFDFPIELEAGFNKLCSVYPNWITLGEINVPFPLARRLARVLFRHCLLLIDDSSSVQRATANRKKPKVPVRKQRNKNNRRHIKKKVKK